MNKVYESNFNQMVFEDLQKVVGKDNISVKMIDRIAVSHGTAPIEYKWIKQGEYPYLPDCVLWPNTTEQVQEIMRIANRYKTVVIPYGGGSGIVGGSIPFNGGILLDTKKLTKMDVNDTNLTVTVQAGVNGQQFEDELNRLGYTMGHLPQSIRSATIGGWIGPNAIGTFSTKYGKIDDMVIALEVVLPTGELMYTRKSPKASCGPDLNQLFVGSEGAYGIITEATFRIWPIQESREFDVYTFPTTHNGLEAIRKIMRTGLYPAVVRLYDEDEGAEKIEKFHYEKEYAILFLGFDGSKELVALERKICKEICLAEEGIYKGNEAGWDWFENRISTQAMIRTSRKEGGTADAIEVSAPWDKLEDVWRNMRNALLPLAQIVHCHFSHIYHTGGSVYVIFYSETGKDDIAGERRYLDCVNTALEACIQAGGTISHHHGVGAIKSPWMKAEHNEGYEVMKKIKKVLDPNNILNPPVLGLGGDANVR